ncbi:hypothetical protein llap_16133 [Limosa lapponica baueri]|uniref:Nuclear transcription factor Y subunit beta n=1 Tax=Limosa lapponica baueri TaxID=1758121 RepID=A0A2I0TII9_LIMLA|nr:hypothetical protein llap_16133 [Limosa lapponica baueri]
MFLHLNSHLEKLYQNIKALERLAARHIFQSLNLVRIKILVIAVHFHKFSNGLGTAGSNKRKIEVGYDVVMNGFKEKIAKDAKECVQECVSEFISFITSEASERCHQEKRKTINGEDILFAMSTLGFDSYVEPLKLYLQKFREISGVQQIQFS